MTSNLPSSKLYRTRTSDTTVFFPLGISPTSYTPAELVFTGGVYLNVVDYAASGLPITASNEGIDRAWNIQGVCTSYSNLTLQHEAITEGSIYVDNLAFITQYQGLAGWSNSSAPHYIGNQTHQLPSFNLSGSTLDSLSWFTKASDYNSPLPIADQHLDYSCSNGKVSLYWDPISASVKQILVEKSTDLSEWILIDDIYFQESQDNIDLNRSYYDLNHFYLRYKEVNHDGKVTGYDPFYITCNSQEDRLFKLFPNPNNGIFRLTVDELNTGMIYFELIDLLGEILWKTSEEVVEGFYQKEVDLSGLRAGMYYLNIRSVTGQQTLHLLVD